MSEAAIGRIEAQVADIHARLFGNGREGLITLVARGEEQRRELANRIDDIEERRVRQHRWLWGAVALVAADVLARTRFDELWSVLTP